MRIPSRLLAAIVGTSFMACASAQVIVKDAWARATVPQQKATGAFMQLTAAQDSKLVSVSSPSAPVAEVHEMSMQDGVMRMRPIPALALPAGKTVALTPSGYHVMLMDLKQALRAGDSLPLTLIIETQGGKRETVEVRAEVRALGSAMPKPADSAAHPHQH